MTNDFLRAVLFLPLFAALSVNTGCSAVQPRAGDDPDVAAAEVEIAATPDAGMIQSDAKTVRNRIFHLETCDGFILLVDGSGSMEQRHFYRVQHDIVKRTLAEINKRIPSSEYSAALRLFNHNFTYQEPYQSISLYPVAPYDRGAMQTAIAGITNNLSWTWSSLGYGLDMAGRDLQAMNGHVNIVLISDGDENSDYALPIDVVEKLKKEHDGRLCIFAVQISSTARGRENLDYIVDAAGCGRVFTADKLADDAEMEIFIKEVFGAEEYDDDYDGVSDDRDLCLNTPAGVKVDNSGCNDTSDLDGDGVYDLQDKCPDTPKKAPADTEGCWSIQPVYFDYNDAVVQKPYRDALDTLAEILQQNPEVHLGIHGHTSTEGSGQYNSVLSEKRADAVRDYLVAKGIAAKRLAVMAYGETKPARTEKTTDDMPLNRRVELSVSRP